MAFVCDIVSTVYYAGLWQHRCRRCGETTITASPKHSVVCHGKTSGRGMASVPKLPAGFSLKPPSSLGDCCG